jgi:hypothetical protein
MHTKIGDNFVAHNLDIEFALFGAQTWEIWCWQGRVANQENLNKAEFFETKFASLPRRISCKARWHTPQDTSRVWVQTHRHPKMVTHLDPFITTRRNWKASTGGRRRLPRVLEVV